MMVLRPLKAVASWPATRAFALSAIVWLLIFAYCDQALWRDPHGAYFHSEHIYDLDYSQLRQDEARHFLLQHSNRTAPSTPSSTTPLALCAAFVTVRREHPDAVHYFPDAIGSMLEGLSPQERAALNVSVLFANAADPAQHPDFDAPWLRTLVDHASGYEGLPEAEMNELRRLEEASDFQRKGVLDYLYVLDQCYRGSSAPFIAVFEDDIIFAADWFARTLFALQHLTTAAHSAGKEGKGDGQQQQRPWLYLRLFYSETFLTWDARTDWWYGNLNMTFGLVCFTSATVLLLAHQLLRLCSRNRNHSYSSPMGDAHALGGNGSRLGLGLGLRLDVPTILVLSFIVAPAFTVLVFMAGKYNLPMYALRGHSRAVGDMMTPGLQPWQKHAGVVPMERQGCCSQALVFDRERVPELMAYLRERGRGQTDLMIEEYCGQKGLRRFALGEQAVQHLGVVSSRGTTTVNGRSVWAFYFEENREEVLRQRHQSVLEKIDWGVFDAPKGQV